MKKLSQFVLEEENNNSEEQEVSQRGKIKFTIWETNEKIVTVLKDNKKYQKIEYKHKDKDKKIFIDFLLGFVDDTWKLWVGKIGSCSYDDDPYCSLNTDDFKTALLKAIDEIEKFIGKVEKEPDDYVRFYKN